MRRLEERFHAGPTSTDVDPSVDYLLTGGQELVMDAQQLWKECSETLRSQVSEATWKTWFEAIKPFAVTNGAVVLSVPSTLVRDRLEGRYAPLLADAMADIAGEEVPIRIVVHADDAAGDDDRDLSLGTLGDAPMPGAAAMSFVDNDEDELASHATTSGQLQAADRRALGKRVDGAYDQQLYSRYTFDAFVIGSSNRFAHAAAVAVAEMPGRSYNPLFVYGDAGLGKTHLLHAIGNYVRENFPQRGIRYVSTETFMNEFVEAIRSKDMTGFKRRYRECDVLLVDDVQFMEGKEQLQEEFFHTFNHLYGASKQMVLTSDRNPKAIATLEDRLKSRFMSGLITEVQPPELETRIAILRTKAEHERVVVNDEVLEFIASNVKDNIRELEGALTRVTAFASLDRRPLTRELAENVLADLVASRQPRRITAQDILKATSEMFGFPIDELCGPSRRRPLVLARQISMYVFREVTDFSFPAIAREFGGRDHTTVIHAVEKIGGLMSERRQVYEQVTALTMSLRNGE
ncbi:MAG TPA: chromosomal replication initiator protein DnaA [Acidimicrobiales bacterium]|nr:chromosomal replication initiator protein DnaA [Acidimicrobiales bacterium]